MPDAHDTPTLFLATRNPGKVVEFVRLLEPLGPLRLLSLLDRPDIPEIEEAGETFDENAQWKARFCAERTGLPSLADDSGLAIDALDGWPGVRSARCAPTAEERNRLVLEKLGGAPSARRTARYIAVAAIATPGGRVLMAYGECEGRIAPAPKGAGGFGYDPIFALPDRGRTMAELSAEEKDALSHRGMAVRRLLPSIRDALGSRGARQAAPDAPLL